MSTKKQGNPLDVSQSDNAEDRLHGEDLARGLIDGRTIRRKGRAESMAFKTTLPKRQQIQRLTLRTGKTMTEVIELALDAYEKELDKGLKR
jgi:hypothetical protein